ncbi:hypothetical protein ACFVYA_23325 [Amycolatopsis sp. NPDC058278]|uniref:hypothetical protein n=1 Tax=unclassified Amycolatopsis TaxID=2618356 RepID=UPI00255BE09A|nr:hypothetical protein [Amycolatopsis sp. DG1A-15b]WIX84905.1 hypothetical protein QRY02_27105 [Amycolatopsis sp. DG1A-15b]
MFASATADVQSITLRQTDRYPAVSVPAATGKDETPWRSVNKGRIAPQRFRDRNSRDPHLSNVSK